MLDGSIGAGAFDRASQVIYRTVTIWHDYDFSNLPFLESAYKAAMAPKIW